MKKIATFLIASLMVSTAFAQSKNPTNKKELDEKLKQAQEQLNKLSPEQRKMMEQMGFSVKAPTMPSGFGDADIKVAMQSGSDFGVPAKNNTLLGAIPKITLTATSISPYLKTLGTYVDKGISESNKLFAQDVYASLKMNKFETSAIANVAVGYWAMGQLETAVFLMSKISESAASDVDIMSNYAAMLSMSGAPHRAMPLLEYLNRQYPENTTILNNLAQAWFYLGEVDKADVLLDKVVKAFAYHPQANFTQCLIQQSKGNVPKAIEKMKNSLAYSFSLDKVNMLRKLGYKLKASDMRKPFRPDPNPLGLQNMVRPEVPKSYDDEMRLDADWDSFQEQGHQRLQALAKEIIPYQQAAVAQSADLYKKFANKSAQEIKGMKVGASERSDNLYRVIGEKNLEDMKKDGGIAYRLEKSKAQLDLLIKDFVAKDGLQRKVIEKQNSTIAQQETELAKKGENIGFDNCQVQRKYSEWVYKNYNLPIEEATKNYLQQLRLKISEELYWKQFTQDDNTYAVTKINAKIEWLGALVNSRYLATDKYGKNCIPQVTKESRYKLADFDEMHCTNISVLDFGVYKQIVECGKMRVEFDAGRLKGNFDFKAGQSGKDHFVKGSMEATAFDKSVGKGPLEASAKAGMGVEFTSRGVEDVYVSGEVSAVNIAASGRMSLISGSMSGGISGFGK